MDRQDHEMVYVLVQEGMDAGANQAVACLERERAQRCFYERLTAAQEQYYFNLVLTILGRLGAKAAKEFQDYALNNLEWAAHHQQWYKAAIDKYTERGEE